MTNPFCPKCGKETSELIEGFCRDCIADEKKFVKVPDKISIEQCKHCNSILLKNKWINFDLDKLKEHVKSKIKIQNLEKVRMAVIFPGKVVQVHVEGEYKESKVKRDFEIPFKIQETTCDTCMKRSANFWQVKVQMRKAPSFDFKKYDKIENQIASLADFLKETKQGPDYYFINRDEIREKIKQFEKKYHFKATRSKRFAGFTKRQAKKIKYTYCIRV